MAAKSSTTKKPSLQTTPSRGTRTQAVARTTASKTASKAKPKAASKASPKATLPRTAARAAKPAAPSRPKPAAVAPVEVADPTRDELREAARVLKTKGSKKREKRAAASVMSNYGSKRGGQNRARNLTPEQRTEIARSGGLKRQEMARQQRELREAVVEAATKKKARRSA